jgi:hypothetical protein
LEKNGDLDPVLNIQGQEVIVVKQKPEKLTTKIERAIIK